MKINLRFQRRAQVTLFIIIGLIILIIAGIALYMSQRITEEAVIPEIAKINEVPADLQPIKSFVESCLMEKAEEALRMLGDRGGYIDPEKQGLRLGNEPTESDLVRFAPGSDLKVPYWVYLKSSNKCTGNCQFKIVPENELFLYRKTGKVSIEGQVDDYINEHLASCLADFQIFKDQGYTINPSGEIKTTTKVRDTDIEIYVNYPVQVERNGRSTLQHYYVIIPLNLRKIYEQAVTIANLEGEFKFLEKDTLNLLSGYTAVNPDRLPPMSESTFLYGKTVTWRKSDVKVRIQEMLATYIQLLQVYGSLNFEPYNFPGDDVRTNLYNAGMLIPSNTSYAGLAVSFNYLNFWDPIYFDLNCKGELCQPESGNNPFINFMGLQRYEFVYDISFPTLVEINDPNAFNNRGYDFRFFLEANIRNNQPLVPEFNPIEAPTGVGSESMLCDYDKRNSGNVTVTVKDGDSNKPLDGVQITYTCTGESCYMGETKNGALNSKFPICLGGILGYIKEGYLGKSKILTTELDRSEVLDDLILNPMKEIPFVMKKNKVVKTSNGWQFQTTSIPLDNNEEAMITLTRKGAVEDEEFFSSADIRGNQTNGTLRIVPGVYDIDIQLLTEGDLVIPERKEKVDTGLFSEKTITYPKIDFNYSTYPSGGLKLEYTFTKEDLAKNKLILYAVNPDIAGIPESARKIEDLDQMYQVENYSEKYSSSLKPRFE